MKYAPDYSDIRGFNDNTVSSLNTEDERPRYNHAELDRDFDYAKRLKLNSVRVLQTPRHRCYTTAVPH